LKGKYLASYPWLGERTAENKARYDVFWLEDQAICHHRFKKQSIEEWIIQFYGAQQWDTWKSRGNAKLRDSKIKRQYDEQLEKWPTHRVISSLAGKYEELGTHRPVASAREDLLRWSEWYRGKSDIMTIERAAMRYFGLKA
jgi:hypothetical protein